VACAAFQELLPAFLILLPQVSVLQTFPAVQASLDITSTPSPARIRNPAHTPLISTKSKPPELHPHPSPDIRTRLEKILVKSRIFEHPPLERILQIFTQETLRIKPFGD
jgi:hypothetical protein